jgi:hypothetical protein
LADVTLPAGFSWETATTTLVGNAGTNDAFTVQYTPTDLDNYNEVTNIAVSIVVAKAAQSIIFNPATTIAFEDGDYQLAATATSGLTVNFSLRTEDAGKAEINASNQLTPKAAGEVEVTASVDANANYVDAAPVAVTITITQHTNNGSIDAASVSLYPNPVDAVLTIDNGGKTIKRIVVYEANGLKIVDEHPESTVRQLSTAAWPQGLYIVMVESENSVSSYKVIKK